MRSDVAISIAVASPFAASEINFATYQRPTAAQQSSRVRAPFTPRQCSSVLGCFLPFEPLGAASFGIFSAALASAISMAIALTVGNSSA